MRLGEMRGVLIRGPLLVCGVGSLSSCELGIRNYGGCGTDFHCFLNERTKPGLPIGRAVVFEKLAPDVVSGVNAGDDRIKNPGGTIEYI